MSPVGLHGDAQGECDLWLSLWKVPSMMYIGSNMLGCGVASVSLRVHPSAVCVHLSVCTCTPEYTYCNSLIPESKTDAWRTWF